MASYGIMFVLSETMEFAIDNPVYTSLVGLFMLVVGLEVSGYGIVCQIIYNRREKELNHDLTRVREFQQQMSVLKTVRTTRQGQAKKDEKDGNEESEASQIKKANPVEDDQPPTPKTNNIDISALTNAPILPKASKSSANSSTGTAETDGSSKDDDALEIEEDCNKNKKKEGKEGAAENAYEAVKDAWTWGRHETPLSPLLGIAEGLTCQAVGLFGTDMKGLDDALKPRVADLDEHVLRPTLSNVSSFLDNMNKHEGEEED